MIDSKELKLGNFVFEEENDICQIAVLYSDKKLEHEGWSNDIEFEIEYADREGIYLTKVVNPIPLTPQLLSKIEGFKKDDNEIEWTIVLPIGLGEELFIEFMIEQIDCGVKKEDGSFVYFKSIQSLHQLQNLYFCLSGEQLKINL